jgi:hypothetical protein
MGSVGAAPREIVAAASTCTVLFALNMLCFVKVNHEDLDLFDRSETIHALHRALPCALLLGCAAGLLLPWRRRRSLWALLRDTLLTPCRGVRFVPPARVEPAISWPRAPDLLARRLCDANSPQVHVFVADWLTSLVKVFAGAAHIGCVYASGEGFERCAQTSSSVCYGSPAFAVVLPLISSLPLLLRLLQCLRVYAHTGKRFPHVANGLKYCFALCIVVLGSTHAEWKRGTADGDGDLDDTLARLGQVAWVASYVVSTLYTYSWDVFMDWGLKRPRRGQPWRLLRERRLLCAARWPYYVAVGADLVLRFLWTLTLAPGSTPFGSFVNDSIVPALAYLEVVRRSMWSAIRIENEQINNTMGYRRVEVVPLAFDRAEDDDDDDDDDDERGSAAEAAAEGAPRRRCTLMALEIGGCIALVALVYIVAYVSRSR